MRRNRILVVDDDAGLRRVMQIQLEEAGHEVLTASDGAQALAAVEDSVPSLVITDFKMPGLNGLELLKRLHSVQPDLTVIIITAFGSIQTAVEAMRTGAYDYLTKPIDYDELLRTVDRALERHRLLEEVQILRSNLDAKYGFENIIGRSPALMRVLEVASRAARADATVLITGETGTGKELVARAIHQNSPRASRPFVTVNCGAIPRELLESELFGHVKGSFTGAVANRKGKAEMADGGTLFLDEIGEMPPELQVKLLRLIQNGEIEKVGGATSQVDVRILAATNRNLVAMIEDGGFREDLYYRLAVIPLHLPPLRERAEDIPELVQRLFERAQQKHGRNSVRLSAALLPRFSAYHWPGNVRELENVIERLVVLTPSDEIRGEDLPDFLRRDPPAVDALHLDLPPGGISLESVEKDLILRALKRFDWNQTQAARYLDISRRTLIYRMEKHGIPKGPASEADSES